MLSITRKYDNAKLLLEQFFKIAYIYAKLFKILVLCRILQIENRTNQHESLNLLQVLPELYTYRKAIDMSNLKYHLCLREKILCRLDICAKGFYFMLQKVRFKDIEYYCLSNIHILNENI